MVAGAAALIQSIRRARSLPDLSSVLMREALLTGATPQADDPRNIGPLPNLRAAIDSIPLPSPSIAASGSGGTATVTWNMLSGVSGYEVWCSAES
jgi:hypothetical protein